MRTAVVILNWNTRDYLGRFLPPLLESLQGLDAGVVVADNASIYPDQKGETSGFRNDLNRASFFSLRRK